MAAAVVQEAGGTTGVTAPASYSVTLSSPTVNGNFVVIIVASDATVGTPSGFTLDRSQVNSNGHYHWSAVTTGGETTWTVTPNVSAAGVWYVAEISGLAASATDQVISTGSSSAATTRSTGTTGTTAQADELAFASFGSSQVGAAATFGAQTNSFVERIIDQITVTGGTNIGLAVASKVLSATGTVECTATIDAAGSAKSTGILVTYKVAAGGATVDAAAASTTTANRTAAAAVDRAAAAAQSVTAALTAAAAIDRPATAALAVSVALSATAAVTVNAAAALTVTATALASAGPSTTPGRLTGTTQRLGGPT